MFELLSNPRLSSVRLIVRTALADSFGKTTFYDISSKHFLPCVGPCCDRLFVGRPWGHGQIINNGIVYGQLWKICQKLYRAEHVHIGFRFHFDMISCSQRCHKGKSASCVPWQVWSAHWTKNQPLWDWYTHVIPVTALTFISGWLVCFSKILLRYFV